MNKQIDNEIQKLVLLNKKMKTNLDDMHFVEFIMILDNIRSIILRMQKKNLKIKSINKNCTIPRCGIGVDLNTIK